MNIPRAALNSGVTLGADVPAVCEGLWFPHDGEVSPYVELRSFPAALIWLGGASLCAGAAVGVAHAGGVHSGAVHVGVAQAWRSWE